MGRMLLVLAIVGAGCQDDTLDPLPPSEFFTDGSAGIPGDVRDARCMDAAFADADGDGTLDLFLAFEFQPNRVLFNDGTGAFTDRGALPLISRDSEDIVTADFDGDSDIDVLFVSEDDQVNELYLNDGSGAFGEGPAAPTTGTSNAAVAVDVDADQDVDIVIGNNGDNVLWLNDGAGNFVAQTLSGGVTQDVEAGDVDADGDLDLIVANEGQNELFINDGTGRFIPRSLPVAAAESREADFGDVDGDGDLDLLVANVALLQDSSPQNQLLLNDGTGAFTTLPGALPPDTENAFDGDFVDLDGDGDLDIILAISRFDGSVPSYTTWENFGEGRFQLWLDVLPQGLFSNGFDVEAADVNGDGRLDLYLCSRGGADYADPRDFLLLGTARAAALP